MHKLTGSPTHFTRVKISYRCAIRGEILSQIKRLESDGKPMAALMEFPGCDFCSEFRGGTDDTFSRLVSNRDSSRVITQAGSLRLVPSLGEIVPGHLLIIPTYHVTSFLGLKREDRPLLSAMIKNICQVYKAANGESPVFFEHGDPTGKDIYGGQCISHAHIHAMPVYVDMLPVLNQDRAFLGCSSIDSLNADVKTPYVSLIDDDLNVHFFLPWALNVNICVRSTRT